MNKIIKFYKLDNEGLGYIPMYKFISAEELRVAVQLKRDIPNENDMIAETWIDDNMISKNEPMVEVLEKLRLIGIL